MCFSKLIDEEMKIKYKVDIAPEDREALGFSLLGSVDDYFGKSFKTNLCISFSQKFLDQIEEGNGNKNKADLIYAFLEEKRELEVSTIIKVNKKNVIKKISSDLYDLISELNEYYKGRLFTNDEGASNFVTDPKWFEVIATGVFKK